MSPLDGALSLKIKNTDALGDTVASHKVVNLHLYICTFFKNTFLKVKCSSYQWFYFLIGPVYSHGLAHAGVCVGVRVGVSPVRSGVCTSPEGSRMMTGRWGFSCPVGSSLLRGRKTGEPPAVTTGTRPTFREDSSPSDWQETQENSESVRDNNNDNMISRAKGLILCSLPMFSYHLCL